MENEALKEALKLNTTGAPLFLDFYDPAYGGTAKPNTQFRLDSILPINEGTPARLVLRNQQDNKLLLIAPFLFSYQFTFNDIIKNAADFLQIKTDKQIVDEDFNLLPGSYKISVSTKNNDIVIRTREHIFTIKEQDNISTTCTNQKKSPSASLQTKRYYCQFAYTDLLLREFGSMPCCNLIRNEKMLYNVYSEDYDPWNNKSWQALRRSLFEGKLKYCHPNCPYLTSEPIIPNKEYSANDWQKYYLEGSEIIPIGPSRVGIMVGTICNVECIFCPIPFLKNNRTIFTDGMLQTIQKHLPTCKKITFTGGEPLIYINKLKSLEKYFRDDLTVQIVTNGVQADKLLDFAPNSNLALKLSLNCANAEDYIYLHQKDYFAKILDNISKLKKHRPSIFINLKFMVMRRTVSDIVKFAELCCELGVDECAYGALSVKSQSTIDPSEKILPHESEWLLANNLLKKAEEILQRKGIPFLWRGWDTRPDDYEAKLLEVKAKGTDAFDWAED